MLLRSGVRHYAAVESTVMVKELAMCGPLGKEHSMQRNSLCKGPNMGAWLMYMGQQGGQCAGDGMKVGNRDEVRGVTAGQIIWEASRLLELTLALI